MTLIIYFTFQIEWCNGKISWVKESSLPLEVRNMDCTNIVKAIEMVQFGRKLHVLVKSDKSTETHVPLLNR